MKQTNAGQPKRSILSIFLVVLTTLPAVFSQCTEIIQNSGSGVVTSPFYPSHYPKLLNCSWTIKMHMGEGVRLNVDYLDNKESVPGRTNGKCYDKLTIYQILSNGQKLRISSLCALSIAELEQRTFDIISPESGPVVARIEFTSDYATQKTGFSISYTALCNQTIHESSGNLTSPWYPKYSPKNSLCLTKVVVPEGKRIVIQFSNFDIGNDNVVCDDDYISMTTGDKDSIEYAILGDKEKYCGYENPGQFITPSNEFSILFVSDATFQYPGFRLTWSIYEVTTTTPQVSTSLLSTATNPSTTLSTIPTNPSTISTTTTASILTTTNGVLTSTNRIVSNSVVNSMADSQNMLQMPPDLYNGTCSTSKNGFTCQYWNTSTPHRPNYVPNPDNHNYCRTPDNNSVTPWCYTTDPDQRWEDCDIANCITDEITTAKITTRTLQNEVITTAITKLETTNNSFATRNATTAIPIIIVPEETSKPSSASWLPYLFVGLAICLIIIAIFFVVRRKRNKREASNADVHFQHLQTDDNTFLDSRARENTYAEIPFLSQEEAHLNARLRQQSPTLPARPPSQESIDSVLIEKLRATEQDHRNKLENSRQCTIEENCYAMASDVGCRTQENTAGTSTNHHQQAEGNVSTAVQSTSTPIKPPKLSKKKGLSSLFGGNNRKKSHDLESMFPDAIPASGAQTLPPNKSQDSTPNKTPIATLRKPKVAPRKIKPINRQSIDNDDVFTEELVGNHYASPLSFDQKFGFPTTSQTEESNYAIPDEPKLAIKQEKHSKIETNNGERKVPHSSFKISIDPSIIDKQGTQEEQESVDGVYANPTTPTFSLQNSGSIYDQPQSVRSNSDPETMNIEEGYCSMNDVRKLDGALEPGVNLYTAMQPQGLHLDNVSYGL